MNTKNKIIAILMAGIVAMAVGVPMAMGVDPTTSASVNNVEPVVTIDAIGDQTPPCTVNIGGTLVDNNGLDDVSTFAYVVKKPDGTIYKTSTPITIESPWSASFDLDAQAPPGTTWKVEVTATDVGASVTEIKTFTVVGVTAFEIDFNVVNYGSVNISEKKTVSGDINMDSPVGENPPTIENKGNKVMNVTISATGMSTTSPDPSDTIDNSNLGAAVGTTSEQDLGDVRTFNANIDPSATAEIDYTLTAPTGSLPYAYSGTTTVTGITG